MHYVYLLKCGDRRTYLGCTSDLNKRIQRHQKGEIFATKKRLPVALLWYGAFYSKNKAFQFEKYLKSASGRAFLRKRLI